MTNNVIDTARKLVDSGEQMARNIWLAGLGVYSKSLGEAQELNGKTNKLFDELVEKGKEVETATRERLTETKSKASASVPTVAAVEERVSELLNKLSGLDKHQLESMNEKLDKLTTAVDELAKEK